MQVLKEARRWMYDYTKTVGLDYNVRFVRGVEEFVEFAQKNGAVHKKGVMRCPCRRCTNRAEIHVNKVKSHLYSKGFMDNYYNWTSHGEDVVLPEVEHYEYGMEFDNVAGPSTWTATVEPFTVGSEVHMDEGTSCAGHSVVPDEPAHYTTSETNYPRPGGYEHMFQAGSEPLWPGCTTHTEWDAHMRMMSIKTDQNMAESSYNRLCSFVGELLPEGNKFPRNFYETKKRLQKLGHEVMKYDVCVKGCMIFYGDDVALNACKFCGENRYEARLGCRGELVARKSYHYLPLTPRLSRLFSSPRTARHMSWHHEAVRKDPNVMTHPSDAKAWKEFDKKHLTFASEPRNVRLGLCTDGFSPFSGNRRSYSCWPVIVTPYNLPPWLCMKPRFLFLTCLIPGPKGPGQRIDVYLQPLIDELKVLWSMGVPVFDSSQNQTFQMRAALMWTINDFPAYAMLSGWSTAGKLACPVCMHQNRGDSLTFGHKVSWFDCHRCGLPESHPYRSNTSKFRKGKDCHDPPPVRLPGRVILSQSLANIPRIVDVAPTTRELPDFGVDHHWKKRSIFWDLPYWEDNLLRHNLDVMHVEKNVFDNLFNTIMNVEGLTKDNLAARKDIQQICVRRNLEPIREGGGFYLPKASYALSDVDAREVCTWVKELRFPDSYVSNLTNCVDVKNHRLMNTKSHDCHIFLERLMPMAFHCLLPTAVWKNVSELCTYFRDLCASSLSISRLQQMNVNIALTMCKLETQFPPSFFDSMEHLVVHLAEEAILGGPVQYRWMYPFERYGTIYQ